jgi:hypothetical protein
MNGDAESRLTLAELFADLEHPDPFLLDDDENEDVEVIPSYWFLREMSAEEWRARTQF